MPFYFRKSVSAGPFRFNFSSGGIGASVGIKGLRVGTGPRGHYVQAGSDGFYYRATIPGTRTVHRTTHRRDHLPASSAPIDDMIPITSANVLEMHDVEFAELLAEIATKDRQWKMATVLGWMTSASWLVSVAIVGPAAVPTFLGVPLAWLVGRWLDSYRRVVVLFYDADGVAERSYRMMCEAFDGLRGCRGMWHLEAGKAVNDLTTWKREAGASHLVRRKKTTVLYGLPSVLRCNVTPPMLRLGTKTFYFLPDVVLVYDNAGFGAVGYDTLGIAHQPANFIETDVVPGDAVVSHLTWEHPNKSGGPDRRFKSNRQLPVCRYEAMHLRSSGGINELLEFSKLGIVGPLVDAIATIPRNLSLGEARLLPDLSASGTGAASATRVGSGFGDLTVVATAAIVLFAATAIICAALPHQSFELPASPTAAATTEIAVADRQMFVKSPQLNCRSQPDPKSDIVRAYDRRAALHVVGQSTDWSKIEDAGSACWVNSKYLASVAPALRRAHARHHHQR